ncbi:collagen alpha-5(VI) chain-like [Physella acuta]|uniref:collagen alpha-5(VI) chain-like n=1 Tax=Physella acuta TaxID=109671 RepID=UPI0027DB42AF|nr:collagen alpha-5(VI) chain-like [Physella acuta]
MRMTCRTSSILWSSVLLISGIISSTWAGHRRFTFLDGDYLPYPVEQDNSALKFDAFDIFQPWNPQKDYSDLEICKPFIDVMFIFDSSGSIGPDQFVKQLKMAADLTKSFALGPNKARFAAVQYDSYFHKVFNFKDFSDHAQLYQKIRSTRYYEGGTDVMKGLLGVRMLDLFHARYGGRKAAAKFAIVFTDGKQPINRHILLEAEIWSKAKVTVMAVGSANADRDLLYALTGDPDKVYQAANFDVPIAIRRSLERRLCAAKPRTKDVCKNEIDLFFVIDSSTSIGFREYMNGLKIAVNISKSFHVSKDDVRVGAVVVGSGVRILFKLDSFSRQSQVRNALLSAPYMNEVADLDDMPAFIVDVGLFSEAYGGRAHSQKVVVYLTDGKSKSKKYIRYTANDQLLNDGIISIVVGIGKETNQQGLELLSSNSEFVFSATEPQLTEYIKEIACIDPTDGPIPDLPGTTVVPTTDPNLTCSPLADIIWLIDSSGSIGLVAFSEQVTLATGLVRKFKVGPSDVRFGAVLFSHKAEQLFGLRDLDTQEEVIQKLNHASYAGETTYTHNAFKLVSNKGMFETRSGGRPPAARIVLLISDGESEEPKLTLEAASALKKQGVTVVAIGTGQANIEQLQQIASGPENVVLARGYDVIDQVLGRVYKAACQGDVSTTKLTTTSTTLGTTTTLRATSPTVPTTTTQMITTTQPTTTTPPPTTIQLTTTTTQTTTTTEPTTTVQSTTTTKTTTTQTTTTTQPTTTIPPTTTITTTQPTTPTNPTVTSLSTTIATQSINDTTTRKLIITEPTGTPPTAMPCPKNTMADIVLVMDSSNSIDDQDWENELQFAADLTKLFTLGPGDVQFGALIYSLEADPLFNLNEFRDARKIEKKLLRARRMKSLTYTGRALNVADTMFEQENGGRSGVKKIVLLMTDGAATSRDRALAAADKLKKKNVVIIAVGIGQEVSVEELTLIASSKEDVVLAYNFNTLDFIKKKVVDLACSYAMETGNS